MSKLAIKELFNSLMYCFKYSAVYDILCGTWQQAGPISELVVPGQWILCSHTLQSVSFSLSLPPPGWVSVTVRCVAHAYGPIALVLLTLLEVGGLDLSPTLLGVSGSGLASAWYVPDSHGTLRRSSLRWDIGQLRPG